MRLITHQLRNRGLDEHAIQLTLKSVATTTAKVYDGKWDAFREWCKDNNLMPTRASSTDIANFLSYLVQEYNCAPSTLDGYRAAIASVYKHIDRAQVCQDPLLTQMTTGVRISHPPPPPVPKWSLPLVLWSLSRAPYEPIERCSFTHLTHKAVFLVLLGTACRRSELHALDRTRLQHREEWEWVDLLPTPGFRAKFQARSNEPERDRHWHLRALPQTQVTSSRDKAKCPVRALRQYLLISDTKRQGTTKLFIPISGGKNEIRANTITSWIKKVIIHAYGVATPRIMAKLQVPNTEPNLFRATHEGRALGPSYSFASSHPALQDVLRSCYWKRHNTFIKHYLKDVTVTQQNGVFTLAEHVLPGAPSSSA